MFLFPLHSLLCFQPCKPSACVSLSQMVKVSNRAMMLRNCICSNLYFYRTMSFCVYINVFLASVCTIILFSHNIVFFFKRLLITVYSTTGSIVRNQWQVGNPTKVESTMTICLSQASTSSFFFFLVFRTNLNIKHLLILLIIRCNMILISKNIQIAQSRFKI